MNTRLRFLFLFIILLTYCSITKRKYLGGFHIEWRNKKNNTIEVANIYKNIKETKDKQILTKPITMIAGGNSISLLSRKSNFLSEQKGIYSQNNYFRKAPLYNPFSSISLFNLTLSKFQNGRKANDISQIESNEPKEETKKNSIALISMLLGILALISFPVLIFALAMNAEINITLLILGIPILSIISIVLGIITLHRIKNKPDKYKGKWLAVLGIILGGFSLVISLLLTILFVSA